MVARRPRRSSRVSRIVAARDRTEPDAPGRTRSRAGPAPVRRRDPGGDQSRTGPVQGRAARFRSWTRSGLLPLPARRPRRPHRPDAAERRPRPGHRVRDPAVRDDRAAAGQRARRSSSCSGSSPLIVAVGASRWPPARRPSASSRTPRATGRRPPGRRVPPLAGRRRILHRRWAARRGRDRGAASWIPRSTRSRRPRAPCDNSPRLAAAGGGSSPVPVLATYFSVRRGRDPFFKFFMRTIFPRQVKRVRGEVRHPLHRLVQRRARLGLRQRDPAGPARLRHPRQARRGRSASGPSATGPANGSSNATTRCSSASGWAPTSNTTR